MGRFFPKFFFLKTVFNEVHAYFCDEKMTNTGRDEIEDIIFQALGHKERRGILRIIGATPGGVTYSSILGETELNTGHLNYHLRSLEGLIEKGDDRLYRLTPLGNKALNLLPALSQEVDNDILHYVEAARSTKKGLLHPVVKGIIYIGIVANGVVFLAGLVLFVSALTGGGVLGMLAAGAMMLFSGAILWVLVSALRTVPEFIRRLERKILK